MCEKLKPCPFCRNKPYLFMDNFGKFAVGCEKCHLYFGIEVEDGVPLDVGWEAIIPTKTQAISEWNRRERR